MPYGTPETLGLETTRRLLAGAVDKSLQTRALQIQTDKELATMAARNSILGAYADALKNSKDPYDPTLINQGANAATQALRIGDVDTAKVLQNDIQARMQYGNPLQMLHAANLVSEINKRNQPANTPLNTPAEWLRASTDMSLKPEERQRYKGLYDKYQSDQVDLAGNKAEATGAKPTQEQIADLADQLRRGDTAPSLLSKRSASYNALIAMADKQEQKETGKKLKLNDLELQYQGAKRFVNSLNGTNMVKYFGLANSVTNTIDEVKTLAEELKQGSIQKWNAAKRGTVLQVYGNTPQSQTAAKYLAAVNTLKEEFANLINGGYAPTDPAFKLANQQINEDFGLKDMNASLGEVSRLINFRNTAFKNLQPVSIPSANGNTAPHTANRKPLSDIFKEK